MNIGDLIETYGLILIAIIVIKVIYFIILLCKVSDSSETGRNTQLIYNNQIDEEEKQDRIIELLERQNEKLERIAQALEQEEEPYIIEKEDG